MASSWKEKYENANEKGGVRKKTDKGMMYISTPKEIMGYVRKVPKGKLITTKIIAQKLSKKHDVDFTCGMTTGIFASVAANYAEEESLDYPYWRVIKDGGKLYPKYLGEILPQSDRLKKEGFKIKDGKVVDYKDYLI